ncbi:MAG TPA: NTP transferase domain-containing protein, partial [Pirellulales bacterium]|nr:NTP transferase domain-containing protein [Pirellulales bacterium]
MQPFAVIPAAGRSQRMGRPKLLLPWGSTTVFERVLSTWLASRVVQVVVVVHPLDGQLAEMSRRQGVLVVQPEHPPAEMVNSVQLGLAAIAEQFQPARDDAWILSPADIPNLTTAAIDRLISAYDERVERSQAPRVWAASAGGRRAHPVLFPWSLAADVHTLEPGEGLDVLVAR